MLVTSVQNGANCQAASSWTRLSVLYEVCSSTLPARLSRMTGTTQRRLSTTTPRQRNARAMMRLVQSRAVALAPHAPWNTRCVWGFEGPGGLPASARPHILQFASGKPFVFKVLSALSAFVAEVNEPGQHGHTNLFVFPPGAL